MHTFDFSAWFAGNLTSYASVELLVVCSTTCLRMELISKNFLFEVILRLTDDSHVCYEGDVIQPRMSTDEIDVNVVIALV